MMLLGKAAEPVLFASVLYSAYELLPGVPQPGAIIDAPVFVTQQAALDIGGMGLMKMAKHAYLAKDSFPYRVGMILVVLMILNVAMASLEKVVHMQPTVITTIEAVLLMARAVMAVLYGHAIHALKDDGVSLAQAPQQQRQAEELANRFNQQVQRLARELASVQVLLHHRLSENSAILESNLHVQLATELAPVQEKLALIPHLQTHLQQIESSTKEELCWVKAVLEKQTQTQPVAREKHAHRPMLHALPPVQRHDKETPQQAASQAERFDARAFVFSCLQDHSDAKLTDIRKRARASGQDLSESTISCYRKEFHASLAMQAASPDARSAVQVASSVDESESSSVDKRKVASE